MDTNSAELRDRPPFGAGRADSRPSPSKNDTSFKFARDLSPGEQRRLQVVAKHQRQRQQQQQQQQHDDNFPPGTNQRRSGTAAAAKRNLNQPSRRLILSQCSSLAAFLLMIIYAADSIPASEGVDCFKCSSRNGSNPACEDPFHNTNTTKVNFPILPEPHPNVIYHTPCYAGKKGRDGLFPASACIKLTGIFDKTGETLVVRHCALDSGSLTQDTELARMSHCGKFQFEGDLLRGCVLACPEDACNSAFSVTQLNPNEMPPFMIMWLSIILSVNALIPPARFMIGQARMA